jgi:hypothetical protein
LLPLRIAPSEPMPRYTLYAAALVEHELARGLVGAREERADHHASAPAAMALATSPEYLIPPSAMIGTPRFGRRGAVGDRRDLRDADARDDARGADRARADADLDRVGAGVDERLGGLGRGDVAGDQLHVGYALQRRARRRSRPSSGRAPCRHDDVDAALDERLERSSRSGPGPIAAPTRRRPCSSLTGVGVRSA